MFAWGPADISRRNEAGQIPIGVDVDSDARGVEAGNPADDATKQIAGKTADMRADAEADQVDGGEKSVDAESISKT